MRRSGAAPRPLPQQQLLLLLLLLLLSLVSRSAAAVARQPHIVVIVADDMGWNDVSYHGSYQIPTPNIDALAYSGMILNRHYVQPVCTPTRAALMTSKYPIRMGLQGNPFIPGELRTMPPGKILPEYLQDLGYSTHAVGKWHLGFYKAEMTPTYRGFQSHVGYWNGLTSYYDHVMGILDSPAMPRGMYGYDMRVNMTTAWELRGRYATDVFTARAEEVIAQHDASKPLFLYLAHLAVHAGNDGQLVEAPRPMLRQFNHINDPNRRVYAAMVSKLDDSVGQVVQALQEKGMLENTLILFIADNGAPTYGPYHNWGSNYPLRGIKDTTWEGGVRGAAVLWGSMLRSRGEVTSEMLHVTDWLPTFYAAAGGNVTDLIQPMDGRNQWDFLTGNYSSARNETLINIDEVKQASAFQQGRWKLVQGVKSEEFNDYYGDSGKQEDTPSISRKEIRSSKAGRAIADAFGKQNLPTKKDMEDLRTQATIVCENRVTSCNIKSPGDYCLFDILNDPCEVQNVADEHPDIVEEILERITYYRSLLIPQTDGNMDLNGADPQRWGSTWVPWMTCEQSPQLAFCNARPGALSR